MALHMNPEPLTTELKEDKQRQREEHKPPLLGSWNKLYLLVLGNLVFLIVLFYFITKLYE